MNAVISIARFEIWKRRNVFRYENIFIETVIIVANNNLQIWCKMPLSDPSDVNYALNMYNDVSKNLKW